MNKQGLKVMGYSRGGENPIRKTTTKGGNYRPTKSGAGMTAKGSAAAKRRKSYCARSLGQLKRSSAKTKNDPNSRIRQARRRWKC